jgi:virginiamycin B lyase
MARGYLGRLYPKSGLVKEWPSPGGAGSRPYGIAVRPDGSVWYSESGVKTLSSPSIGTERSRGPSVRGRSSGTGRRPTTAYLACSGVNKVAVVGVSR